MIDSEVEMYAYENTSVPNYVWDVIFANDEDLTKDEVDDIAETVQYWDLEDFVMSETNYESVTDFVNEGGVEEFENDGYLIVLDEELVIIY